MSAAFWTKQVSTGDQWSALPTESGKDAQQLRRTANRRKRLAQYVLFMIMVEASRDMMMKRVKHNSIVREPLTPWPLFPIFPCHAPCYFVLPLSHSHAAVTHRYTHFLLPLFRYVSFAKARHAAHAVLADLFLVHFDFHRPH